MPSAYTRKDGTIVRYDTKEYDAQYRAAHAEETYYCKPCNREITILNVKRHNKSNYHLKRGGHAVPLNPLAPSDEPEDVSEPEPEPEPESQGVKGDSMPPVLKDLKESLPKLYKMTVKEMKAKAKELNIKGYSRMTKTQLEDLITKGTIGAPVVDVEVSVPEAAVHNGKGKSPWNQFLKEHMAANKVTLKEAMQAKEAYAAWKAKL